jgi:pimeloyl-ACP methyl ester carboxylesterase
MSTGAVLLIHGMGSSHEHNWTKPGWTALLEETGRRVVGVELPGHGAGSQIGDPTREAAALIIDAAQLCGPPVDAVGFSAGGYALMVAAAGQPAAFGSLALLGVGDSGLQENDVDNAARRALADALIGPGEPADGTVRVMRRLVRSAGNDLAAVAAYLRSPQPRPSRADLAAITARCLVVEGDWDAMGPADVVATSIPGCRRVVLKGVDHFALPSQFACMDAVLRFLDEE